MMDKDAVILLAQNIRKLFVENKDYLILDLSSGGYNELLAACEGDVSRKMGPSELLLDKTHMEMYERLSAEGPLPRRVDNFMKKRDLSIADKNAEFSEGGEEKFLSISLAAILATDTYLHQLQAIREELSVNIRNRHNHSLSPTKLNDVFSRLEASGLPRDLIYSQYCKGDRLKIYKSNLKNHRKTKLK